MKETSQVRVLMGIVALVGIVAAYVWHKNQRAHEGFASSRVAITSNVLQYFFWSKMNGIELKGMPYNEGEWESLASTAPKILPSYVTDAVIIADPLDARTTFSNLRPRQDVQLPNAYFLALFSLRSALQQECSYSLAGKTVAYLDRSDYLFVQAIMHAYRIEPSSVRLLQVPMQRWESLADLLEAGEADLAITHIVPGSGFHMLLQTQDLSVMGFRGLDLDRVRLFYPDIGIENKAQLLRVLKDVPGSALRVMHRERETDVPYFTPVAMAVPVSGATATEGFITRLDDREEAYDPAFKCYGDTSIESKELCNSPVDVIGLPKRRFTVWDKPCTKDSDCPFYKANQHYPNERGGCLQGGVCEFPVGVKRIAYRLYNDKGAHAPFCYQCSKENARDCCAHQKEHAFYFGTPDYAFPNDTTAREKNKLPTILPMDM